MQESFTHTQATAIDEEYQLLSIGDAARIIGVAAHTIRFWEKEFAFFLKPERTQGRQRRYSEVDLSRLQQIFTLLKVEGFSIAGAKRQLRSSAHAQFERDLLQEQRDEAQAAGLSATSEQTESEDLRMAQKLFELIRSGFVDETALLSEKRLVG